MAGPRHPRHYEESFKRQIVQLYELRKRNRQLEMEVDVSEQAAPVFARR